MKFINAVLFQAGWLSCIFLPLYISTVVFLLVMVIHFKLVENPGEEFLFILKLGTFGFGLDVVFSISGFINFTLNGESWLYLLWVWYLFASTLKHSMRFFMENQWSAALLGMLAPFSYKAAALAGRVEYSEPLFQSMLLHALLWGFLMLIVHELKFSQISQKAS